MKETLEINSISDKDLKASVESEFESKLSEEDCELLKKIGDNYDNLWIGTEEELRERARQSRQSQAIPQINSVTDVHIALNFLHNIIIEKTHNLECRIEQLESLRKIDLKTTNELIAKFDGVLIQLSSHVDKKFELTIFVEEKLKELKRQIGSIEHEGVQQARLISHWIAAICSTDDTPDQEQKKVNHGLLGHIELLTVRIEKIEETLSRIDGNLDSICN